MDPQEKLEAMFCPRLDSALVASIYHDMRDFKACIPILSALASAVIESPSDTDTRPKTTNAKEDSAGQSSLTIFNDITNSAKSGSETLATGKKLNKGATSSSNDNNILIWSEEVANSNVTTASSTSSSATPRSSGMYRKQGQISNTSPFQQPTSATVPWQVPAAISLASSSSTATTILPSGSVTRAPAKATFRAQRNPNYLKKHGYSEEPAAAFPEPIETEHQDRHQYHNPEQEGSDQRVLSEEENISASQQPLAQMKKNKKNRRQKRSAKQESKVSSQLPGATWKKEQPSERQEEGEDAQLSSQLSVLAIINGNPLIEDAPQESNDFEELDEKEATTCITADDTNSWTTSSTTSRHSMANIKSEELEFLKSCFPDRDHSDEYLAQVLKDSKRDLEAAVEIILSQMFLENEQVETSSSGSGSLDSAGSLATNSTGTTASSLDDAFFQGVSRSKKKAHRNGTGGAGAWGAMQHQTWDGHSDALLSAIDRQDEFLIPESNEWATFEHQISILMNIFHTVPQKIIVSEYHANGAHLFKTVEAMEKRLKQENHYGSAEGRERQSQFDVNLAQLMELFPDHSAGGLKKMLVYNSGNVQDTMNAVLAADIVREDQKDSRPSTSTKRGNNIPFQADIRFADKNYTPTPSSSGNRLKSLPSTSNPLPNGVRPFPNTLLDSANSELYNDEDDPAWCRERAHEMLEQRNELFRKAAKAYQHSKGKGVGMGGIAAYYADEGKKLDVQGKQWHMRAARAVVQQHRLANNDPNLVDLHGLTIAEAQTVVKEAVTQWFARATMQASRVVAKPLKIICGVGSHSKDRIARLYPAILSLLMKDGWRCEAENGVILVKGVSRLTPSSASRARR
ncbi:hypothetical protein EDD11_010295 [Mortierella claussenii]|nr:hypothetical protein EDD11_010295 [Mortierella claussenii]